MGGHRMRLVRPASCFGPEYQSTIWGTWERVLTPAEKNALEDAEREVHVCMQEIEELEKDLADARANLARREGELNHLRQRMEISS